jgi:hypothetical protein
MGAAGRIGPYRVGLPSASSPGRLTQDRRRGSFACRQRVNFQPPLTPAVLCNPRRAPRFTAATPCAPDSSPKPAATRLNDRWSELRALEETTRSIRVAVDQRRSDTLRERELPW